MNSPAPDEGLARQNIAAHEERKCGWAPLCFCWRTERSEQERMCGLRRDTHTSVFLLWSRVDGTRKGRRFAAIIQARG